MALTGSPITTFYANAMGSVPRRSGGYSPATWSNEFIQSLNSEFPETHQRHLEELIKKTRSMLNGCKEHFNLIKLLDILQKLGVAYHFKKYITEVLDNLSNQMTNILEEGDLHHVSILFRLLRNNGYVVSQDIFKGFLDEENHFSCFKVKDHRGILSLYEASFLLHEGESFLEEAQEFSIRYLKNLYEITSNHTLKEEIKHALEIPLHRRISRLEVHWFIKIYATKEDMNPLLLELAQLDYNKVQSIHRNEIKGISRWWTNIGFQKNIDFFRDRIMECWIWAIGIASYEPKFNYCREHLAKLIALIALLDDFYDIYGTMDEIELFTSLVERWTVLGIEKLPHYMKIIFLALFNYINELSYGILKDKKLDIALYLRRLVLLQCKAYHTEAKWYHSQYIPCYEEYMENATISSGAPTLLGLLYCLGCDNMSNATIDKLIEIPSLIRQTGAAGRLIDDLVTSKVEMERGDVHKALECYINQEKVTEDVARAYATQMIENIWKKMNQERFANPFLEEFIIDGALNFTRTCHCFYQHGDQFSSPAKAMNEHIIALLVKEISVI